MMSLVPDGFQFGAVHAGIKRNVGREDVAIFCSDRPCVAAGAYTLNQVVAAPVTICRSRTPGAGFRAVVVNSGNANACTGELGMRNALEMLALTAKAIDCQPEQVLIMSTGIIGEQLPMSKVATGISQAATSLMGNDEAVHTAARGLMTTDTREKIASRTLEMNGTQVRLLGLAKGSGMIGPNMATMLGVILTDASLSPTDAQSMMSDAVTASFNSISVDGHTSTNDTVLLLANGQSEPLAGEAAEQFAEALKSVCIDLAKQIVDDGEGATHVIEIHVRGAQSDEEARTIAASISNSPLVKTAFAGNDPNWGRIVSAAGYTSAKINLSKTRLLLNGTLLFEQGAPVAFDAEQVSTYMQQNRHVDVVLEVGEGDGEACYWTCDLTHEYVRINADYHT